MATSTREATQTLTTQRNELVKQYIVYDAEQRPSDVYTAGKSATTGTPCTRVRYEYLNPTSVLVTKMEESQDVWDSSYDI